MKAELLVWSDDATKKIAFAEAYKGYDKANSVIMRSKGASNTFQNVSSPNTSVREGMTRRDYDYFRQDESLPTSADDIQRACMQAYDRFGIVRNIIDMMSDFVIKGIDVVHPSPRIQKFGRDWFKKVSGKEVSGKIANMLFKAAAAPVRRIVHKLKLSEQTITGFKAIGEKISTNVELKEGEIPMGYTILNPSSLEVYGGDLALFLGDEKNMMYGVRIPQTILRRIKNPKGTNDINIVNLIPKDLIKNVSIEQGLVPIPQNRLTVLHYKKDDFVLWAKPIIYPILDDLLMLDKLKLADRAALDGAISHVRLWRIGSLEYKIVPNAAVINRLAEMLLHNVGGGCMDLIWGPELDLVETQTESYKFLGNDKYIPTLTSIFQGLGVPPTLTGTSADAGFTNNFISLRILVERLEYCRQILITFWENELKLVQAALGIRDGFTVTFDIPNLADDSAEKKLLIDLCDRNIISEEFLQERFGADPEIERLRILRQQKMRDKGKMPPKAGPYHLDSTQDAQLERMFVGLGELTPSQVGLELEEKAPGEMSPNESREQLAAEYADEDNAGGDGSNAKKPKGRPGRPKGSGDSIKRKQKSASPVQSTSASEFTKAVMWASKAQKEIDTILNPVYLKMKGKDNLRKLSNKESSDLEDLKFRVLCACEVYEQISDSVVQSKLKSDITLNENIKLIHSATVSKFVEEKGVNPSIEESRQIQAMSYAIWNFELEGEDDGEN